MAGDHVGQRLRGRAVRHVLERHAGRKRDGDAHQVAVGADARRGEGQGLVLLFAVSMKSFSVLMPEDGVAASATGAPAT